MSRCSGSLPRFCLTALLLSGGALCADPTASDTTAIRYTEAQAAAGRLIYQAQCANCHGLALRGGESAPALLGRTFLDA
ncbi:MAG: cytochrome c [Luminiphilus sp.]|jgi:mono/diheme cytochrome c family protein|nr:cytochrome c [Luminiphilus sp.]